MYNKFNSKNRISINSRKQHHLPHKCISDHRKEVVYHVGHNSHLSMHLKTVHTSKKNFKCQECSKQFGRMDTLSRYLTAIHAKEKEF